MAGGRERAGSKSRERRGAGDDLSIIWSLFGRNLFRAPGAWEPVQQASRDRARHDTLSVQSFILQCVFRSSWLQCLPHKSYHSTLQSSLLLSASCLTLSPVRPLAMLVAEFHELLNHRDSLLGDANIINTRLDSISLQVGIGMCSVSCGVVLV